MNTGCVATRRTVATAPFWMEVGKYLRTKRSAVASLAEWNNEVARELWTLIGRELQLAQDHVSLLIKTAPERVAS
jgi:hypothetical protein